MRISTYDIEEKTIYAFPVNSEIAIEINRKKFEDFLTFNDKLDWIMDYSEAGNHSQRTGTMTLDEYYDLQDWQIRKDLQEYIQENTAEIFKEMMKGFYSDIQKICQ